MVESHRQTFDRDLLRVVITLRMTASAMARTRLAVSPISEVTVWLWSLALGRPHPLFGTHGPVARSLMTHPDVALVAGALSATYAPDLLTPAPDEGRTRLVLDAQLDKVRGAAEEAVVGQVCDAVFSGRPLPAAIRDAVDSGTFARRAANGLAVFWRRVMADDWASVHGVLEADLAVRTRTMAGQGLGALLGSLHPTIISCDESLMIDLGRHVEDVALGDRGMVLSPSVFNWPNVTAQVCGDSPVVINYPASGLATNAHRDPDVLARLYGDTRASLLADLDTPRSTTELSARHDVAPSTVSYHLQILHQAGLISRHRDRYSVLYQRKPR